MDAGTNKVRLILLILVVFSFPENKYVFDFPEGFNRGM